MFNLSNQLQDIFYNAFDNDILLFAESVANGYDYGNPDNPFSLDADVCRVFVDDDMRMVCVHTWDEE